VTELLDINITTEELREINDLSQKLIGQLKSKDSKAELEDLEKKTLAEDFWQNQENSQRILQRIKELKDRVEKADSLNLLIEDCQVLLEFVKESPDDLSLEEEFLETFEELKKLFVEIRMYSLLNGPNDKNNAYLTLHAGAGGTEACDWVEMLYRMYTRYFESKGFKFTVTDYLDGDGAGIKAVSLLVEGEYVYGHLRGEIGVHRLVRISPFDSGGRRHTSFASCEVIPQLDKDIEVNIRSEDLRIDTFRSSGKGGQHVNKTDSAVRITHLPTNIVVACQSERSQHQNKDTAMRMLMSKLMEIKEREHKEKIEDLKGTQKDIAWGNQIRSYVFCPYTMVKEHRTNYETGDVQSVMDGDLDPFINEYLTQNPTIT